MSISDYYIHGKDNLFPQINGCPNPNCCFEGRLRRHGFYSRTALTLTATYIIFIQRYYCPFCKRTLSLQPSFLAPRFQYSMACIFYILYLMSACKLSYHAIAKKINSSSGRVEMSYQHVSFYRSRLLQNRPLISVFLSANQVFLAETEPAFWLKDLTKEIFRHFGLHTFCLEYYHLQSQHFMSKP